MRRHSLSPWLNRCGCVLLLLAAAFLRSDLSYRTPFVDEAINMYEGWRVLNGQTTHVMKFHMGYFPFSCLPLGLAGWVGGVVYARALNAVWGVLTVWVVMMAARRLYGSIAGYVAGAMFAVFAPAIAVSTLATYDSLSILFTSIAVYLWIEAALQGKDRMYVLGSLAMTLAVLVKYSAVMVAVATVAYGTVAAIRRASAYTGGRSPGRRIRVDGGVLRESVAAASPFVLLVLYALVYRGQLLQVWQGQILVKQSSDPEALREILKLLARYLWLPALLALPALLSRERRALSSGLLAVALAMVPYHLANRDSITLWKHTCYMLVGLAPLAAGGLACLAGLLRRWLPRLNQSIANGVLALIVVGYTGLTGQEMLFGLRSFWPDASELIPFLRAQVTQGDVLLMEGGAVGKYYLVEKGSPGHIPEEIFDTWWYEDEHGQGVEAYKRAIGAQRFDLVVFDYAFTPDLDRDLLALMQGSYEARASFPARVFGEYGTVDVFKPIR